MTRRVLFAALAAALLLAASPLPAVPVEGPAFLLGFKNLADLVPSVVGVPLENEHHNAVNGDGLQMTSTGLMVWRKADNWTAFTNGSWTWVNGPYGVQDRSNDVRFEWEAGAEAAGGGGSGEEASPTEWRSPAPPRTSPAPAAGGTGYPGFTPDRSSPTITATPAAVEGALPTATPTGTPTVAPTTTPWPTATAVPTWEPSATIRPTSSPWPTHTARPTATVVPNGIRSPDPAGEWVTSVSASTKYYCPRSSSYWKSWSAANRIWFATESDLLSAYPERVKRD